MELFNLVGITEAKSCLRIIIFDCSSWLIDIQIYTCVKKWFMSFSFFNLYLVVKQGYGQNEIVDKVKKRGIKF